MSTLAKKSAQFFYTIAGSMLLAACGGSGSPAAPAPVPPPTGGIEGSGIAVGTISGFGSVIVNGIRFSTGNAIITVDGQPGTEDQLAVGQVVVVVGSIDASGQTGTAESVSYDDVVEGPVSSIDLAAGTLVVLGQTIFTDANTSFDNRFVPASLDGISVAQIVEVSGFIDSAGIVRATRIEPDDDGDEFEIEGIVTNLDTAALTFNIGALVVDYSAAALPDGAPETNRRVEVHGSTFGPNDELLASRVEFEDADFEVGENDEVEIEGLITRFVSPTNFDVSGQPVTTNAQTLFENGTINDLALDVKVEAEGLINASGILVAEKIDFRRAADVEIEALVEAVDSGAGTVTMLGITVRVDQLTRFEDQSSADIERFSLANVGVGDFLEVRGTEDPPDSAQILASRLERDEPESEVRLQGFVSALALPDDFVILGVTVHTDAGTQFRDANEAPIDSSQFFAMAEGRLVQAKGSWDGSVLTASEVEFED